MTHKPLIKCQGIKTKLVPWIKDTLHTQTAIANTDTLFVDLFTGSGVVATNIASTYTICNDKNPYITLLNNVLKNPDMVGMDKDTLYRVMTSMLSRAFDNIQNEGEEYYYNVRKEFNMFTKEMKTKDIFSESALLKAVVRFLFLSRACFNGVMRFNSKGEFNVPFCKNTKKFAKDKYKSELFDRLKHHINIYNDTYTFTNYDYKFLLENFNSNSFYLPCGKKNNIFIYADPPYNSKENTYHDKWETTNTIDLYETLIEINIPCAISTWYTSIKTDKNNNDTVTINPLIAQYKDKFTIYTQEHQYTVGPRYSNRPTVLEALLVRD